MEIIELEFNSLDEAIESFDIFNRYHDAIIAELKKLEFDSVVGLALENGITPTDGFAEWISHAVTLMWTVSFKLGQTRAAFFPKNVAKNIKEIASSMIAERIFISKGDFSVKH